MTGTSSGQSVYLDVRTVLSLPSGSAFASHEYDEVGHNSSNGVHLVIESQDMRSAKITDPTFQHTSESNSLLLLDDLYPNPSHEEVSIRIHSSIAGEAQVSLIEVGSGKTLYVKNMALNVGANSETLHLSNLPTGTFLLTVSNGIHTQSKKLTLSH